MNSEELEMSLRTEFESHLNSVLADMRQEFSALQERIEAEFDKHKSQLNTVFEDFSARLDTGKELDRGFKETVVEHLRLARDEGARITATAITEAEEMGEKTASNYLPPSVGVSELRDAINDITAQPSQGAILTSLVEHASQFTPRGAFFIIKNERFVGWRVFGKEGSRASEETVRDILLPVSASTVLGESVRSLSATESTYGTYDNDSDYLDKLEFGQPDRMYAIPLIARGRGVAVLYADYGTEGEAVNVEALETLVRVAGLTVEVLASAQAVKPVQEASPAVADSTEQEETATEVEAAKSFQTDDQTEETGSPAVEQNEVADETDYQAAVESAESKDEAVTEEFPVQPVEAEKFEESDSTTQPAETEEAIQLTESDIQEDSADDSNENNFSPSVQSNENESAEKGFDTFGTETGGMDGFVSEPIVSEPIAVAPPKSRLSERNVDLPIEVGEDERRLHNDARRFARLLVSEIKLYNEQKVKEGRESQDLYERLREAIDRSRDMYDKRVQPPVAEKFDYFHYELVSTLAEGEETKLGGGYPGAAV